MIQYDDSKCDKHSQKRCVLCMAAAAKGGATVSQAVVAGPPPTSISGGPPENIEGLSGSVRDRIPVTVEEAETDYDKILAEVNAFKVAGFVAAPQAQPGPELAPAKSFATLPADDSHASKVMRAAAKYAEAATNFALRLAEAERVKQLIFKAEAEQNVADAALRQAEAELKSLVSEGT